MKYVDEFQNAGASRALAARIRAEAGIPTMAVGQITEAIQAETIVASGQAACLASTAFANAQASGASVVIEARLRLAHEQRREDADPGEARHRQVGRVPAALRGDPQRAHLG